MTTFQVLRRMNFSAVAPEVFTAVLALHAAAREGQDPELRSAHRVARLG
ncbi:hypothetical protein [Kitasatospora griseola]|nr:hypothetical protein [Kitasatospora griseola]